jgi:hypothetical protein
VLVTFGLFFVGEDMVLTTLDGVGVKGTRDVFETTGDGTEVDVIGTGEGGIVVIVKIGVEAGEKYGTSISVEQPITTTNKPTIKMNLKIYCLIRFPFLNA